MFLYEDNGKIDKIDIQKSADIFKEKFPDELDISDACEFRMWRDQINRGLNQQGYWLFDEG